MDEIDIDLAIERQQELHHQIATSSGSTAYTCKSKRHYGNATEEEEEEEEIQVLLLPPPPPPESSSSRLLDTTTCTTGIMENPVQEVLRLRSTVKSMESTIDSMESEIQLLRASSFASSSNNSNELMSDPSSCPVPTTTSCTTPPPPNNDDDDDDDLGHCLTKLLPQDTFSFLLISKVTSVTFVLAVFVYGFQMVTFALVTVDGIEGGGGSNNNNNPFGIPGDVSAQVRTSQFIAILVAVFTQGDLMTGFGTFRDGYNHQQMQSLFPDSCHWKYILSLLARLTEGAVGLMVSFLLIVSAEEVKELLLNFTAIEFVSNLDEVVFFLSKQGFLGKSCKMTAIMVSETLYQRQKKHGRIIKIVLLLTILLGMMIGWGIVIHFQLTGKYLCETVQVQFDDDFLSALGPFGGLYDLKTPPYNPFSQQRVTYVERRAMQVNVPPAQFAYCNDLQAWTFHWSAIMPTTDENITSSGSGGSSSRSGDPCVDWVARSASTESFELAQAGTLEWMVRNSNGREVGLNPFHLQCFQCRDDDEDSCGGHGVCITANKNDQKMSAFQKQNTCQCHNNSGFYGLRCEFEQPCSKISVDSQTDRFVSTRDWADTYDLFIWNGVPIEAYNRPVYIHSYGSDFDGSHDLIIFLGRRWGLTSSSSLPMVGDDNKNTNKTVSSKQVLANFFQHTFHAHLVNINSSFAFLTEPADAGTPKDDSSPVGLNWYRTRTIRSDYHYGTSGGRGGTQDVPGKLVDTLLLCTICDDLNPCSFDGRCLDQICHCSPGSSGALCQVPPTGNGYCNAWFNTPEYAYDMGDCCESTCQTTSSNYQCGYEEHGLFYKGYPFCKQQSKNRWYPPLGSDGGSDAIITGQPFAQSGTIVALARNGRSLAVAEPGASQIRLFDMDGAIWNERVVVPEHELLDTKEIQSLTISSGPTESGLLLNSPGFLAPLLLAVAGRDKGGSLRRRSNSTALIFYCDVEECQHQTTIQSATNRVALSKDGSVLATVLGNNHRQSRIQFWEWRGGNSENNDNSETIVEREMVSLEAINDIHPLPTIGNDKERIAIKAIQLSGNGDVVALEIQRTLDQLQNQLDDDDPHYEVLQTVVTLHWNGTSYVWDGGISQVNNRYFRVGSETNIDRATLIRPSFALSRGTGTKQLLMVVAISKCTHQAFEWTQHHDNGTSSWIPLGDPMISQQTNQDCQEPSNDTSSSTTSYDSYYGEDYLGGGSIAISDRGTTVIIGMDSIDVATFEWNGLKWIQVGDTLESGPRVALAIDGQAGDDVLAVGLPTSQGNNAGGTSLYSRLSNIPLDSDILQISVTPDTVATTWTLESNTSAGKATILAQGGGTDRLWELASFTQQVVISTNDCIIFTIYPYELNCMEYKKGSISSSGCKPPKALPKPRFSLMMNSGWFYMGWLNQSSSRQEGNCGHQRFAPQRIAIGGGDTDCLICPNNTQTVQVMISACVPTSWELKKNNNNDNDNDDDDKSDSVLLGEQSFCGEARDNSGDGELVEVDCLKWYGECINMKDDCYTFSISIKEEMGPDQVAGTELIPIDFYLYVDGDLLVSGVDSTEVQIGHCV